MIATLTYIWHDCFLVRTESASIVFDFWKDPTCPENEIAPKFLEMIDRDKPLYVITSHHHKDHFNREIFKWGDKISNIRYIISKDIERSIRYMLREGSTYSVHKPDREKVTMLRPDESFTDDVITVNAFASTDTGNSYLVELDGFKIFHAGDLNAWIWKEESTKAQVAAAIRDFSKIVDEVADKCESKLDLAMFPVDSRQGLDYFTGASLFLEKIDVRVFAAMHYGLGETEEESQRLYRNASDFKSYANLHRGVYVALRNPYDSIALAAD